MTMIRASTKMEDCFDGSMIYQITLMNDVDDALIAFLRRQGALDYYPDFPKPLFRIDIKGLCHMTGYLGSPDIRVVLYRENPAQNLIRLETLLESSVVIKKGD